MFGFLLLFASNSYAQVAANANSQFRWDHPSANITDAMITRFELQIDTGNWTSLGMTLPITDPLTPPDHVTFSRVIGVLTPGVHTARIRACNDFECGPVTNTLSFRMVVGPAAPILRLTQSISVAGIIERNPYQLGNISVIDVRIPEYNVILNFGSPTWNIPGVYTASVGDKVFLSLNK